MENNFSLFGKSYYCTIAWCGDFTITTYIVTPIKWTSGELDKDYFKNKQ